jgi:septum formation protein
MLKICLGSASPRRKDILSNIFSEISILHPDINEDAYTNEDAYQYCKRIADEKSLYLLKKLSGEKNFLLVCGDTTVSYKHHILGKPKNYQHALEMLNLLNNSKHEVLSSISLTYCNNHMQLTKKTSLAKTSIFFKKLDDVAIKNYLASISYLDKAGAYAIQQNGEMIIEKIKGSYTNVVGFPLRLFYKMLSELQLTRYL